MSINPGIFDKVAQFIGKAELVNAEKVTALFGGKLHQCHLICAPFSERRFCLGVESHYRETPDCFKRTLGLLNRVYHYDMSGISDGR